MVAFSYYSYQSFGMNLGPTFEIIKCQFTVVLILKAGQHPKFYLWKENSNVIQNNSSSSMFTLTTVGFINS